MGVREADGQKLGLDRFDYPEVIFFCAMCHLPTSPVALLFKTEKHVANLEEDIRDKVEGVGRF